MAEAAKLAIVTGGTSGLGRECARRIAATPGWAVVLTGRDRDRTDDVARTVGAVGRPLDLGSLTSVREFVAELRTMPPPSALVCNAGLQFTRRSHTADGVEATFGVNHLGHFALVRALLPGMSRPGRIVFVTSGTHDPARPTGMPHPLPVDVDALAHPSEPTEPAPRDGRRRYSTSKLANLMTTYELARRLADDDVTVNAFDPGLMPGTGLARDAGPVARALWRSVARGLVALPGVNTPARSGADLARLVTEPALDGVTGRHIVGRRERPSSDDSYDQEAQRALYDDSIRLLDTLVR